ncbi:MAG: molybdenum cofactor guanylyltransferase [Armatimonadetes bacterium]|nr:molybdenum cofactor guanylyltransferase [Armatimonadota bacterium]
MATIILAGGLSMRMGLDKASLVMAGCTMIASLATRFAREMGPVIVVLRPGQELVTEHATTVYDLHQGVGPLGGLHAGLLASPDETNFVIACDMPFADPELACYILSALASHDAAVPMLARGPEPLHCAYHKSCLPTIESSIAAGRLRMRDALDRLDVLYIPEKELKKHNPDMRSFINVNTPEDYIEVIGLLDKQ